MQAKKKSSRAAYKLIVGLYWQTIYIRINLTAFLTKMFMTWSESLVVIYVESQKDIKPLWNGVSQRLSVCDQNQVSMSISSIDMAIALQ